MDQVARVVLALEAPEVAEEVMHFLDRSGRARVVATAGDDRQLAEAIRQLEPDAIVAAPTMLGGRQGAGVVLALDTRESVTSLRAAIRGGRGGLFPVAEGTRGSVGGCRGRRPAGPRDGETGHGGGGARRPRRRGGDVRRDAPRRGVRTPRLGDPDRRRSGVRRRRAGARRACGRRRRTRPHVRGRRVPR